MLERVGIKKNLTMKLCLSVLRILVASPEACHANLSVFKPFPHGFPREKPSAAHFSPSIKFRQIHCQRYSFES
jgi:hypothetical protein